MPNVNYRGNPSQDPNAPPESGVTSIPLGTTRSGLLTEQEVLDMVGTNQHSPWPPLSREQVVQLHEALIEFLKAPMVAPNRLAMKLLDLGIGRPAAKKTSSYCAPIFEWADRMKAEDRRERWEGDPPWAETEIMLRRVIYALRGFMCGWDKDPRLTLKEVAASEGLALLALLREAGIESLLPKHMSLIGIPADELPSWPKDQVAESRRIDEKIAQAARLLTEAGILSAPPPTRTWTHEEVAKVAEEVQEEPPKRNCWTCDHDKIFGGGTAHICTALPPRRAKGIGDSPTVKAISAWTDSQTLDTALMPPKTSDGCPGWEPKP